MKVHTPQKPIDEVLEYIKNNFSIIGIDVVRNTGSFGSSGSKGYRQFNIPYDAGLWKKRYVTILSHHISWYLSHNEWPEQELDHKDDNKLNNNPENLQYLSRNKQVSKRYSRTKNSGLPPGVKRKGPYFEAYITIPESGGKKKFLGSYKLMHEAGEVYLQAYHDEYGEELEI